MIRTKHRYLMIGVKHTYLMIRVKHRYLMISVEHSYHLSSVLIDACETLVSAIECLPVSLSLCLNVGQSFFLFRSVFVCLLSYPSMFICQSLRSLNVRLSVYVQPSVLVCLFVSVFVYLFVFVCPSPQYKCQLVFTNLPRSILRSDFW